MSRRGWMNGVVRGAAKWLPLLLGTMTTLVAARAQTNGVAPLVSGDCTVTSSGTMTCAKTNGTAFAPSATTDATNASNIGSGTLSAARLPSTGVGASTVSNATVTYDNTGRITAITGLIHPSWTAAVFGESVDLGSGATVQRNGYGALMKKDTPTMAGWLGNFAVSGTTAQTIALSLLANMTPNATYPSTWYIGAGGNDALQCPTGTANCIGNYTRATQTLLYWGAVAPQQRTLGSNMTKSGSWASNTSLAPVNTITGGAAGSATQSSTSGDTLTLSVPATNNGEAGLYVYIPTGTTGATYTITNSTTGTNYTDSCNSGSPTFNAFGCGGTTVNLPGVHRIRLATTAGTVNTITVTHTNAAAFTVVGWDYTASTLAANTNAVIFRNTSALFDTTGWTATAAASAIAQARADGLVSVLLNDARTAQAAVGDGAGGAGQTYSSVYGTASTQPNHPRDYSYVMMEQSALQAQIANNYVVSVVDAGLPDPENVTDTRPLKWATPFLCNSTWATCYRNLNAGDDYQTSGAVLWGMTGNAEGYRIEGNTLFNGFLPNGALAYFFTNGNVGLCVQKAIANGSTASSNFTTGWCARPDGASMQASFAGAAYTVRAAGSAVASAATIAPAAGITHVAGTAAITTITPPAGCTQTGYGCDLTLIPDGAWTLATGGNIAQASAAVVNRPMVLTWVNADGKWYSSY